MIQGYSIYGVGAVKMNWTWIFLLTGLVAGFLVAVIFARFDAGRSFLDAFFRGLSMVFQSPPRISRALSVWRENRQRHKLRTTTAAHEIAVLKGEIDEFKEQVRERKRKIREARWATRKP